MASDKIYALTVFGATGFTGERVAREAAKRLPPDWPSNTEFRWAIAGRDRKRLEDAKSRFIYGKLVPEPDILIADSKHEETIREMCAKSRVVVNCVGPFRFHGEKVVKYCVESGTDYTDITGEPEFVETMFLKYFEAARKSGSTITSYCGMDSLPAELGTLMVKKAFAEEGALCSQVEMFHTVDYDERYGVTVNYATYESAVNGFGFVDELRQTRKLIESELNLPKLPQIGPKLQLQKGLLPFDKRIGMYTIVFPGADASAVRLGQRQDLLLHGETKGAKQTKSNRDLPPVQFAAYFGVRSWWNVILVAFYGAIFALLARFSWGRRLLLDYSWLFTHGVFVKGTTPSEEQLKGCSMETILIGRGYKSGSDQGGKPDREIVGKVSGPEPGYVGTPIFIISCAHQLLKDKHFAKGGSKIPSGVILPSCAFADTDLIERLTKLGEEYEIVSRKDLK